MRKTLLFLAFLPLFCSCNSGKKFFKITWKGIGEDYVETYMVGEIPTYKFSTAKDSDETFNYEFSGWDHQITPVSKDETYEAIYEKEYIEYDIHYRFDDKILTLSRHFGDDPSLGDTYKDDYFSYSILGYEPELHPVTKEETYRVNASSSLVLYKVDFDVNNVITTKYYPYNSIPQYSMDIDDYYDDSYLYTFKGWDKEIAPVTKDTTYKALFNKQERKFVVGFDLDYKIIYKNYDKYQIPSFDEPILKPSDPKYSYEFDGWDKDFVPVDSDIIYKAQYKKNIKSYHVSFLDIDDSLLYEKDFKYDEVPVFPYEIEEYKDGKKFAGWFDGSKQYKSLPSVTRDIIYKKAYRNFINVKVNQYYLNGDIFKPAEVFEYFIDEPYSFTFSQIGMNIPNQTLVKGVANTDTDIDVYYSNLNLYDGFSASRYFSQGSGTKIDPYRIKSGNDLALIKKTIDEATGPCYTNTYFKLTNSIDLSLADNFIIGQSTSTNPENYFNGTFDGNNCFITGLKAQSDTCAGLFAKTGPNSNIENLSIYGNVIGQNFAGGFVGRSYGSITNCNNYADVTHSIANGAGGISGEARGKTIFNCVNYGNITNLSNSQKDGGIAGSLISGILLENCANFGNVKGYDYVGGLVGYLYSSSSPINYTIKNCLNYGTIYGARYRIGGILGGCGSLAYATISNCQNFGNVEGDNRQIGGIMGYGASTKIEDCQNHGLIRCNNLSDSYTGGIVGEALPKEGSIINRCQNFGDVIGYSRTGGLVGNLHQNIANSTNYGNVFSVINKYGGWLGGICGVAGTSLNINNCINKGSVNNYNHSSGGIIGTTANAEITIELNDCINYGYIKSGTSSAGGIIGNNNSSLTIIKMKRCINYGLIEAYTMAGGLFGRIIVNIDEIMLTGPDACMNKGIIKAIYESGDIFGSIV